MMSIKGGVLSCGRRRFCALQLSVKLLRTFSMNASLDLNPEFVRALKVMEESSDHCLITGKAGTGKSTLLEHFRSTRQTFY